VRHKDRYAKYLNTLPLVGFVCRDEDAARERMFVCAERAIHEGSLEAPSNGGAE
jgi:hypothetical protein